MISFRDTPPSDGPPPRARVRIVVSYRTKNLGAFTEYVFADRTPSAALPQTCLKLCDTRLGSPMGGVLLVVAQQVLARRRVVKPHLAPPPSPEAPARAPRSATSGSGRSTPPPPGARTPRPPVGNRAVGCQMLTHRVEQEVFLHSHPCIHPGLPLHVLAPRVRRRHLQQELRSLALLPHLAARAQPMQRRARGSPCHQGRAFADWPDRLHGTIA